MSQRPITLSDLHVIHNMADSGHSIEVIAERTGYLPSEVFEALDSSR